MPTKKEIKDYWERKILKWERLRYSKWLLAYPLSWTVRWRMHRALEIIKMKNIQGVRILELGCGSGILAQRLEPRFVHYVGVDIASCAISKARSLNLRNAQFIASDVFDSPLEGFDLTVFLGLTDWMEERSMRELFKKIQSPEILFSYTEKRVVSRWNPYWYYRHFVDGKQKEQQIAANNYEFSMIESILNKSGFKISHVEHATIFNPGVLVWASKC